MKLTTKLEHLFYFLKNYLIFSPKNITIKYGIKGKPNC